MTRLATAPKKWTLIYSENAKKNLGQLDKVVKQRIVNFLNNKVIASVNPRTLGKPLRGKLRSYWSFRVGEHRIISYLEDEKLIVCVVQIGHRREVYKHI
ncbi:MAG: type II toxin-antitoxin system RelE/ParE family toxin [Alphaproteobacteria bacterium]